jgi:2-polyprenyl-6-hydroxyphenyl methylase/3-demethylubiquinone-9 3-methyltransferase
MGIGASVRRAFGPWERQVASAYRGIYLDLGDLEQVLAGQVPQAARILEVGGGEGAVTELLARTYREASILSIDITPRIGRLYAGREDRVEFRHASVGEVAHEQPRAFDLVVVTDVLHHVPQGMRENFLGEVYRCVAPGGQLVIKEWARSPTPIHWLCHASDRWLTGDRVAFLTPDELRDLVARAVPGLQRAGEGRIAPWGNNFFQAYLCPAAT